MTPNRRLLDLFCGAGGAARGYQLAGFHVTGVDISAQPHYIGDAFYQADALVFPLDGFDAIHASPPCQAYTTMSARWRGAGGLADSHPMLIGEVRARLEASGVPFVLENVEGAASDMGRTFRLHGGMFGLGVHRPRLFESNVLVLAPMAATVRTPIGVYGDRPDGRWLNARADGTRQYAAASIEEAQGAMGMDWGDWEGVKEAIPPAYTEFIGRHLLRAIEAAA